MFDGLRTFTLRLLRVPHDPDAPAGAPGTAQVFRAGRNFYNLRLARWTFAQLGALAGIAFSLTFIGWLQQGIEEVRADRRRAAIARQRELTIPAIPGPDASSTASAPTEKSPVPRAATSKSRPKNRPRAGSGLHLAVESWPPWVFPLVTLLEWGGIVLYLVQIPVTYAMVRLDYELRWYIVTDRSLRIRMGLASVQEMTMSFANVQQVVVSQGPLQRLLGIADVRVQSAGGGGDEHDKGGDTLHTGIFHGVDNASEIRDLILERLRLFRQAGLGDPDDTTPHRTSELNASPPAVAASVMAARELLQEAQALRRSIH